MEIKRDYYLQKLIAKKHNGLIKVITGMRRCGKSYLLFTLFKKYLLECGVNEDHIIEIPFDSFENKKYRDPEVLYPYVKAQLTDDQMYYILLDEVQLLDEFESVLNGFIRIPNVDVYFQLQSRIIQAPQRILRFASSTAEEANQSRATLLPWPWDSSCVGENPGVPIAFAPLRLLLHIFVR